MKKKNYIVMLLIAVAVLFALFIFVFSTKPALLSPQDMAQGVVDYSSSKVIFITVAAFLIGLLIVIIVALLVLIGVGGP